MAKKKNRYRIMMLGVGLCIGLCVGFIGGYYAGHQTTDRIETIIETIGDEADSMTRLESEQEPALTIDGIVIDTDELNARVYMARDQYVALYGEEPWLLDAGSGQTVAEYAKAEMLEEMERVTLLCEQADAAGMVLSAEEKAACLANAKTYMADLGEAVASQFGVTEAAVCLINEKNALAMDYYNQMMETLSASLREEPAYQDMEDGDFETVLLQQFDAVYQTWQEDCAIETMAPWDELVMGAVG